MLAVNILVSDIGLKTRLFLESARVIQKYKKEKSLTMKKWSK